MSWLLAYGSLESSTSIIVQYLDAWKEFFGDGYQEKTGLFQRSVRLVIEFMINPHKKCEWVRTMFKWAAGVISEMWLWGNERMQRSHTSLQRMALNSPPSPLSKSYRLSKIISPLKESLSSDWNLISKDSTSLPSNESLSSNRNGPSNGTLVRSEWSCGMQAMRYEFDRALSPI